MLVLIIHEKKITSFQTSLTECDSPLTCISGTGFGLEHFAVADILFSCSKDSFFESSDESSLDNGGKLFTSSDCFSILDGSFLLSDITGSFGMNSGTSGFKLSPIDEDMLSDSLSLPIVGIM